jgi:hypothetical protein
MKMWSKAATVAIATAAMAVPAGAGIANAATAAPAAPVAAAIWRSGVVKIPDARWTGIMISRSLGLAFYYSSGSLGTAEGVAYNQCLRAGKGDPSEYKNDCNDGYYIKDGYAVAWTSGPYTHGNSPYAYGVGWARTQAAASKTANYYCKYYGGKSCRLDSIWEPATPIPAKAVTMGGKFS